MRIIYKCLKKILHIYAIQCIIIEVIYIQGGITYEEY